MSRKKTSESVDEILREVREQNAQAAAQSAASDTQVDLILASLGMGQPVSAPAPGRANTASFTPASLPAQPKAPAARPTPQAGQPIRPAAPAPARTAPPKAAPAPRAQAPKAASAPKTAPKAAPKAPPARKPAGDGSRFSTTANLPKTASEVQRYFRKTSPADELEDPGKLLQREKYFQDFFRDHQAVVPDDMKQGRPGRAVREEEPAKKAKPRKSGFFGFGRKPVVDEETGEILIPAELNAPVHPAERKTSLPTPDAELMEEAAPEREAARQPLREPADRPSTAKPAPKPYTARSSAAQTPARKPTPRSSATPDTVAAPAIVNQTDEVKVPPVRPGVEHQGTLAFPYYRTPRSSRTHIKTIEFEPAPRPKKKRGSPTITMHVSLPPQEQPVRTPVPPTRTPAPSAGAGFTNTATRAPIRQETMVPPPSMEEETDAFDALPAAPTTDTGAVRLDFVNNIADAINNGKTYETSENARHAAEVLTGRAEPQAPKEPPRRTRLGKGKNIPGFGRPAEETEDTYTPPFEEDDVREEYVDDYNRVEDAPLIRADLQDMVFRLRLRSIVGGLTAILLLVLDILARGGSGPIAAIDPALAPQAFLAVNLILLVFTGVLNRATLLDGVVSFRGNPSADTVPFLAYVASALQLLVFLVLPAQYAPTKMTIFAGFAALLLCVNALGKSITCSVVARNFDLVSNGVNHVAAYTLQDDALLRKLSLGLGERRPKLLISRPTPLVKGFITNSFSARQSDLVAQNCAIILLATAVVTTVINAVVQHNVGMAVSMLPAVLCFGAPLCATFVSAVPEQKMHKSASRVGAVVPGWSSINQLGHTNIVLVSANDLFPVGSVSLHGIKTFEKERIDTAILYAASILVQGCDTLQDVFLGIIQNNRDLLMKVENLTTELGGGFVGWIENNRVIVGNRALMQKYDIEVPSMEYEKRFTQGGRKPIYLAVAGKLFGMFLVSYSASPEIKAVVDKLRSNGISLMLTSDDFSVDSGMVEAAYGLPQGSVKVLSAQENDELAPAVAWLPESEGCMIHLGSFASFVGGLQAAGGAAAGERSASMVMIISVIISCMFSLALSISGNNAGLALPVLLLYQLVWSAISLAFPLVQKY